MLRSSVTLVGISLYACVACPLHAQSWTSELESALNARFEEMMGKPHVVNACALVDANGGELEWKKAAGFANPTTKEKMTTSHQFRTASVSKSFTGCVIVQLIEEGKLTFDTPLSQVLGPDRIPWNKTLAAIHQFEGKEFGEDITIRHLLNHTSGLSDYWFDKGTKGSWKNKTWLDVFEQEALGVLPEIFDPPTRLWHPNEVLQFHYETGLNESAHFQPGKKYLYSDTNFLLLGMVIEDLTGKSYSENLRKRIFEPLEMTSTYTEFREKPTPPNQLAHHFFLIKGENLDVVELKLASTAEWANGGHVTTLSDLRHFIRALFAGKLFKKEETLDRMLNAARLSLDEPQKYFDNGESTSNRYSCGLERWKIGETEVWGHTGFWGIGMFYIPVSDVSIVFAKNQVEGSVEDELRMFAKSLNDNGLLPGEK